ARAAVTTDGRRPRRTPPAAALAAVSARLSHHRPKANMTTEAMLPRPGEANGVVPKKGIGIAFWMAGVPGRADIVNVEVPNTMAAGIRRRAMSAAWNSDCAIGASTKKATKRLTPP